MSRREFSRAQRAQIIKRAIRIYGDVAFVPLTQSKEAVIDAADADMLSNWDWCLRSGPRGDYAGRGQMIEGRRQIVYMHRFLLAAPDHLHVDHINGDGLDNRRANLRTATFAQNRWNEGIRKNNQSGFKGVSFVVAKSKWRAEINASGRKRHLGYFGTAEEASAAYKAAAGNLHAEFARTE